MEINLKPVVTENTLALAKKNWYTFAVPLTQNKNRVRKLVEEKFKVKVVEVRTVVVKGKTRRSVKTRRKIKLPSWKKALVKVAEGQKIESFETGGTVKPDRSEK